MRNTDQLFESLFKRNFRSVDTKAFLTALTKEYPYFTAAQFYLLKLSEGNSRDFSTHAAKTSLLFNNPFWLNFQLNQKDKTTETSDQVIWEKENAANKKPELVDEKETWPNENGEIVIAEPASDLQTLPLIETATYSGNEEEPSIQDIATTTERNVEDQMNKPALEAPLQQTIISENVSAEQAAEIPSMKVTNEQWIPGEDTGTEETSEIPAQQEEGIDAATNYIEAENNHTDTALAKAEVEINDDANISAEDENNIDGSNVTLVEMESLQTPPESIQEPSDTDNETAAADEDNQIEQDDSSKTETEPMILKIDFDVKSTTTEDTISYQPLYTSDYFASLGIRINEDGIPVDRLGKQLKSFTDWLKVMKRIHPDHLPQLDEVIDSSIQEIAEKSNKKGEVLTEAMADVLIQQGKTNKAIELYQKLSLLNPSKSAYFAAKIDEIRK